MTEPQQPSYLLTGATGFLGQYLLRDALLAELPIAVLVRKTRSLSAARRIDAILAPWEQELQRTLPRPVVLDGDLTDTTLRLSPQQRRWLARHCPEVIHCAASVKFEADPHTGEPSESNVGGTQRLLEFCREVGITTFHHVSTAYVCGRRTGRILESELDCGQVLANDYEQSKFDAEQLVREATHLKHWTIFRPSIVVGDSQTGYTSSFHGVYAALRVAYCAIRQAGRIPESPRWFFDALGMLGHERKNLVPVDWVAAVMGRIIRSGTGHGRTYHLTNPRAVHVEALAEASADAIARLPFQQTEMVIPPPVANAAPGGGRAGPKHAEAANHRSDSGQPLRVIFGKNLEQHLEVYRAYLRDDPEFDGTQTRKAVPDLPCPELDAARLARLVGFATERRFEEPRVGPILPEIDVERHLATLIGRPTTWFEADERARSGSAEARSHTSELRLEITGCGGGAWRVRFDNGDPVAAIPCLDRGFVPGVYTTSRTFADLVRGRIQPDQAVPAGRLLLQVGSAASGEEATSLLRRVCTFEASSSTAAVSFEPARDGELSWHSESRL